VNWRTFLLSIVLFDFIVLSAYTVAEVGYLGIIVLQLDNRSLSSRCSPDQSARSPICYGANGVLALACLQALNCRELDDINPAGGRGVIYCHGIGRIRAPSVRHELLWSSDANGRVTQ